MTEVELAFAAGLFAGEGCVGNVQQARADGSRGIYLAIQMLDERSLIRFAKALEPFAPERSHHGHAVSGFVAKRSTTSRYTRPMFYCSASGRVAYELLRAMWPYLRGTDMADQAVRIATLDRGVPDWMK